MNIHFICCAVTLTAVICGFDSAYSRKYDRKREKILEEELKSSLGGKLKLTAPENKVNKCLMRHKLREIDYAFDNPQFYNFSRHFFIYKNHIPHSSVYKIIRDMPKGAALHVHDRCMLGPDYLLELTYLDDLHVCIENESIRLKFARSTPLEPCDGYWQLMSEARNSTDNAHEFDGNLRKHFTLYTDDPDSVYPTKKESWDAFMKYFETVTPLLTYKPVWEQYFYDALKQFREHNIMYVEFRSVLPHLYDLDGTAFDRMTTAETYRAAIERFLRKYDDFIGAKLIYAPSRKDTLEQMQEHIDFAMEIKENMPEYFAGFDLSYEEDLGNPIIEFAPVLESAAGELDYFFHAGETNWFGCSTDNNLADAILLGAKRIGHAYALSKHPGLIREVIKKDIALEVNVISNSVLSLVRDVRNHPLSIFLAQNLPVVLSSDDPGAWEAGVISEDFYVAFVGVSSQLSDLRLLKTLALNSIKYSAMNNEEKKRAWNLFDTKWDLFIDTFECSHY